MSKSLPTILGLGVAGCVLLSLMMQHLVGRKAQAQRSPYAPAIEAKLGSRLVGSVRVEEQRDGGWLRLVVHARIHAGLQKRPQAEAAGLEAWIGTLRAGRPPHEVVVVIDDDDGGEPLEVAVAAPRR